MESSDTMGDGERRSGVEVGLSRTLFVPVDPPWCLWLKFVSVSWDEWCRFDGEQTTLLRVKIIELDY